MLEDIDGQELLCFRKGLGRGGSTAHRSLLLSQAVIFVDALALAKAETTEHKLVGKDQLTLDVLHLIGLTELVDRGPDAVKTYCIFGLLVAHLIDLIFHVVVEKRHRASVAFHLTGSSLIA